MPGLSFTGDQGLDGHQYGCSAPTPRPTALRQRRLQGLRRRGSGIRTADSGPLKLPVSGRIDSPARRSRAESTRTPRDVTVETPIVRHRDDRRGQTARVDLPDLDPRTTRYYWTVVPVAISGSTSPTTSSTTTSSRRRMPARRDAWRASARGAPGDHPTARRSSRASRRRAACSRGVQPPGRLLDAARRVEARRRATLRGAVVADHVPVAPARHGQDLRDVVGAEAVSGHLVLPRPRAQPGAARHSAMTWSRPVAVKVARPTFKISG